VVRAWRERGLSAIGAPAAPAAKVPETRTGAVATRVGRKAGRLTRIALGAGARPPGSAPT